MGESPGNRTTLAFVVGLLLGLLLGAGGVLGIQALSAEDAPVASGITPPPAAPAVVAPVPEPPPLPVPPPPAPEPAPAPARPAARPATPAPTAAPPPKPAVSTSRGPTKVVFVGADGQRYTPDAVPPGKFEVHADWGEGLVRSGEVTVKEGKAVKLVCDPPTKTCTAK